MKTLMLALLILLPVLASAQTHRAQPSRDCIFDPSTSSIPGAEVTVTNIDTKIRNGQSLVSDAEGDYCTLIARGLATTRLQVASPGF